MRAVTGYFRLVPPPLTLYAFQDEPQAWPAHQGVGAPLYEVTVPHGIEGRPYGGLRVAEPLLLPDHEVQQTVLLPTQPI